MKWTVVRPESEGYYWLDRNAGEAPCVVKIYERDWYDKTDEYWGFDVKHCGSDCDSHLEEVEGRWSGPLEMPDEPAPIELSQ